MASNASTSAVQSNRGRQYRHVLGQPCRGAGDAAFGVGFSPFALRLAEEEEDRAPVMRLKETSERYMMPTI
jgi:hypothetical protein